MLSIIWWPLVSAFFYFVALVSVANNYPKSIMPILTILCLLAGELAVCTSLIVRKIAALIDCIKENKEP